MASTQTALRAAYRAIPSWNLAQPETQPFSEVLTTEHQAIAGRRQAVNERRRSEAKPAIGQGTPFPVAAGSPTDASAAPASDQPLRDVVGLALSGGGIRSAAVCLGGLQALYAAQAIDGIDYLSTVSGGGYIGSCMTAAMSQTGQFPFATENFSDTPAVGHIRNFSNYLMPRDRDSVRNVVEPVVIILRGILANAVIVFATLLLLAYFTAIAYPNTAALRSGSFLTSLGDALLRAVGTGQFAILNDHIGAAPFRLTIDLVAALAVWLIVWVALRYSGRVNQFATDAAGPMLYVARWLFIACVLCAALDLQPLMIGMLHHAYRIGSFRDLFPRIATAATTIIGLVGAFSGKLGLFLKASEHDASWNAFLRRAAVAAVIWLASLLLFILLYVVYLHLSAWTIPDLGLVLPPFDANRHQLLVFYGCGSLGLIAISWSFNPNAYSLHRLYRDRLAKAFIFEPPRSPATLVHSLDKFKLSEIDTTQCPYHILNAAMNVEGSLRANQRGREADFFIFSRHFIGSDLTGYAFTRRGKIPVASDMEQIDPMINLATAMAISGAAVSANMGSDTIRPLSPTLALLNVRLGYWLRNPRDLAQRGRRLDRRLIDFLIRRFYLLVEMSNWLTETSRYIYLTDGGHIENLGVYQLLKRKCKLIIVFDAECDPSVSFPSFIRMERYARIDLGILIDLPWQQIASQSASVNAALDGGAAIPNAHGPHCALGHIRYEDGTEGVLLYVKSSVTGDEPDYVVDYKKRYPGFPHETTGDQFFSEEQFEAYRALGFHALQRAFDGTDAIPLAATFNGLTAAQIIAWIRSVLG